MGEKFTSLNYYEMLDLQPDATLFEIRHAYNAALQMYQADSLISYSFFPPAERETILGLLEKAYLTLINEQKRQDYDNELIQRGVLQEKVRKTSYKIPVNIFDINRDQSKTGVTNNQSAALRTRIMENKIICAIISQREVSGADLRQIRNELAIPLEQIAQATKIRIDYLHNIEADIIEELPAKVFLKGFIKAYLKCLCLEPADEICNKYINRPVFAERK